VKDGGKFGVEIWEKATTPKELLGILLENLYVAITRDEFRNEFLPKLRLVDSRLAAYLERRVRPTDVFAGDTL